MQELYNKLKKYSITDAIKIEESDRQYIALEKMWENLSSPNPSPLEDREIAQNFYL
ncbi:MAG: hypothetical protein Q8S84_09520 [bacterium]|nr:hypothetical protein [bacterium]MDP3381654.1 hypothetical protein [bacterium]